MATALVRQLQFVTEYLSQSQISAQTGIPRSTIGFYARGERRAPLDRQRTIRNLYQRTAFAALREQGLSSTQARRFSWYRPERVREILTQTGSIVETLARSRFADYRESLQRRGLYTNDDDVMQSLRDSIEDAIRRSELPTERLVVIQYGNTIDL